MLFLSVPNCSCPTTYDLSDKIMIPHHLPTHKRTHSCWAESVSELQAALMRSCNHHNNTTALGNVINFLLDLISWLEQVMSGEMNPTSKAIWAARLRRQEAALADNSSLSSLDTGVLDITSIAFKASAAGAK